MTALIKPIMRALIKDIMTALINAIITVAVMITTVSVEAVVAITMSVTVTCTTRSRGCILQKFVALFNFKTAHFIFKTAIGNIANAVIITGKITLNAIIKITFCTMEF